jgi:hypothetical protein
VGLAGSDTLQYSRDAQPAEPALTAKILNLIALTCLIVIATGVGTALFVRGGPLHAGPSTLHDLLLTRHPTVWPTVGWSIAGFGAVGLVGVIFARIMQGSIGDLLPNRRWFQFSLKTMLIVMTLAGVSLGWSNNYRYCAQKAVEHHSEGCKWWLGGHFVSTGELDKELQKKRAEFSKSCYQRVKYHEQLEIAYKAAAWRPWERFWINDPPLEDIP